MERLEHGVWFLESCTPGGGYSLGKKCIEVIFNIYALVAVMCNILKVNFNFRFECINSINNDMAYTSMVKFSTGSVMQTADHLSIFSLVVGLMTPMAATRCPESFP